MKIIDNLILKRKINTSYEIISRAYDRFGAKNMALAWTGGKDSTLILWLTRQYALSKNLDLPQILFIDEGDVFTEIIDFTQKVSADWKFKFTVVRNDDVIKLAKNKLGNIVKTARLNAENKRELDRLGFDEPSFPFEPESFVGNHLMKTAPLNAYIRKSKVKAVITGIRRDENPARSNETEFSDRTDPDHTRVHPIVHYSEKDVWSAIHLYKIPYVGLYEKGYRSLGARSTTHKAGDLPAWQQDYDQIKERAGRQQDKEQIMEKLRKLGYM